MTGWPVECAERLTSTLEWDNKAQGRSAVISGKGSVARRVRITGRKKPPREESMEFEKDQFEDDDELSRLEDDEELGGESGNIIEEEAEILSVEEEPAEEAPTARLAPKAAPSKPAPKAAKKPAPKAAKKSAKKAAKKKAKKAKAKPKKTAKKAGKKRRR